MALSHQSDNIKSFRGNLILPPLPLVWIR